MAKAIVTLKIMPTSPDVDMAHLSEEAKKLIADFAGEGEVRESLEPVAFGLKALKIIFVMEESRGSPDVLEQNIAKLDEVNSVEVTDVRRAIG